jgi:transposase
MVVGAVLDDNGRPICCEMWPGNTTDVTTVMPQVERLSSRFGIGNFCIVADRGMISADTLEKLDEDQMPYILGTRMRRVKKINGEILTRGGRYTEVCGGPQKLDNVLSSGSHPKRSFL